MKFVFKPLAAALCLASFAHADTTETSEETNLPPVVVSASRLPETAGIASSHVQIISAEDIRKSGTRNLADLLRQTAAIQLIDAGSGTPSVSMRGFGENAAQNTLILLDGRRLNNDSDISTPALNNLSLDDIDHIEIINGSAGALYGAGAVGGLVNIITKSVSRSLQAGVTIGNNEYVQYRIRADERVGNFGAQAIGEKTLTDNYRDQNGKNDAFAQVRLTWNNDVVRAYTEGSHQDDFQQYPGSLFNPQYTQNPKQAGNFGDYMNNMRERFNAGLEFSLPGEWTLKLDGSHRKEESEGQLTTGGFPSAITQNRKQVNLNPQISGDTKLGSVNLNVVAGFDSDSADYYFNSALGSMTNNLHINAGYTQFGFGFGKSVELVTGIRRAKYRAFIQDGFTYPAGIDIQDTINAGSVGLYWSPSDNTSFWLRADENFRFALTDEQTGIVFGGTVLEAQEGLSKEAGFRWAGNDISTSIRAYQLELENEISYNPILFGNINLDDTRRRGANLDASYRLTPSLTLDGQYAYLSATFTAGPNIGKRVPMVANNNATLRLNWEAFSGFTTSFEQQRLAKRHVGGDYANAFSPLSTLYLFNIGVNYHVQNLESSLRINNLLDKKYAAYATTAFNPWPTLDIAYLPAAERNMTLSLLYRFF